MSEGKDGNVNRDGKAEIDRYFHAEKDLEMAKGALNRAQCEMDNATNALGKWLTPTNAKDGEQFCVWHAGSLIQAVRKDVYMFDIVIRERGKRC